MATTQTRINLDQVTDVKKEAIFPESKEYVLSSQVCPPDSTHSTTKA